MKEQIVKAIDMIQTRQNSKGNWWCNATIFGYDHSFEGETIEQAREQMIDLITKEGKNHNDYVWDEPTPYPHKEQTPKGGFTRYKPMKLDNL